MDPDWRNAHAFFEKNENKLSENVACVEKVLFP